jgi:hypothetical protein
MTTQTKGQTLALRSSLCPCYHFGWFGWLVHSSIQCSASTQTVHSALQHSMLSVYHAFTAWHMLPSSILYSATDLQHSLVSIQADNVFAHSAKCIVRLDRSANSTGAQLFWETAVVGSDYWLTINHGPLLSHATQTKKAPRFVNNRYNQCMTPL